VGSRAGNPNGGFLFPAIPGDVAGCNRMANCPESRCDVMVTNPLHFIRKHSDRIRDLVGFGFFFLPRLFPGWQPGSILLSWPGCLRFITGY
jgi:hypothetical protein